MTETINMQQAEYEEVLPRLRALHEQLLNDAEAIMQAILMLSSREGDFFVKDISAKVTLLLNQLKEEPLRTLTLIFVDTELAITTLMEQVKEIDVEEGY